MKYWIPLILFLLFFTSCENEQEPAASIEFKTGSDYTSQDATIPKESSIKVGIVADKAENNLKAYNVSVSYDGASTTITVQDYTISSDENKHYDKDVHVTVRTQTGTEKYYFTIVDVDGNVVQKMLTFRID